MPISRRGSQHALATAGSGANVSVSFPAVATAGDLVLVAAMDGSTNPPLTDSVTDNQGNVYTRDAAGSGVVNANVAIFSAQNVASSGTFTVTHVPQGAGTTIIVISEYLGARTSNALDVSAAGGTPVAAATWTTLTTATAAEGGGLAFACATNDGGITPTTLQANSPYGDVDKSLGTNTLITSDYSTPTVPQTHQATWALTPNIKWDSCIAVYRPAPVTITINRPSGTTQDSAMVALIAFLGNDSANTVASVITDPAGWSKIFVTDPSVINVLTANLYQIHAAIRIAGAAEPANYTWSGTAPNATNLFSSGYIVVYENVDVATPQDAAATSATASNNFDFSIASPTIKTKTPNALILSAAVASLAVVSPPTPRVNNFDVTNSVTLAVADSIAQVAGVVGVPKWFNPRDIVLATIALRPARTVWDTFAIKRRTVGATTFKPARSNIFQRHFQRQGATGPALPPFYLTEWPLPRLSTFAMQLRSFTDPMKQWLAGLDTFFGGPGAGPDYDWPNPRGYTPGISLRTFTDPLKVGLSGLDKFFGDAGQAIANLDWPVPKGPAFATSLRTWIDTFKINLRGLDTFFGLPGMGPDYDYPNPRGKDPTHLRTFIDPLKTWLAGLDTFFGGQGQAPANLDWPVPKAFIPNIVLRTWTDNLKQWLAGADFLPFRLSDWPNPPRGFVPSIALRTWTDALKQWLTGLDRLPFALSDWPNPRGYIPGIDLRSWLQNLVDSTLQVFQAPFFMVDWPNPRGYVPGIDLRTFTDPLKAWLTSLDTFFGSAGQVVANLDWPVPKGRIPSIDLKTWLQGLVTTTLRSADTFFGAQGQGIANLDWPVPKVKMPSIDLRTWTDPFKVWLVGADTFFGAPGQALANLDWPVPKVRLPSIDLRTWLNAMQQQLIGLDVLPFRLSDWPVPKVRLPGIDIRTFTDPLKAWLTGLDFLPFNTTDWPVPKVRLPSIDLKVWLVNLQQSTLFQIIPPFFLMDWPNPRGYIPGITLRTFTDPLKAWLAGLDVLPFKLSDWPNPRGYIPGISLRTFIDQLRVLLTGLDTFFGAAGQAIANLDWPVPKGYIPGIALRTWLVNLVDTTLVGADKFFGASGQAIANLDWPVPKGYIPGIALRTWIDPLKQWLAGLDFLPFSMTDWPVPKVRQPSIDLRTWLIDIGRTTLNFLPFSLSDWPVPKVRLPSIDLRTWAVDLVRTTLRGADVLPFSLSDWPVPKVRMPSIDLRSWVSSIITSAYAIVLFFPFYLLDWPVPKGRAYPSDLRTWLNMLRLNLIGRDALPFRLSDWPVPKGRIPSIDLKTWLSNFSSGIGLFNRIFSLVFFPRGATRYQTYLHATTVSTTVLVGATAYQRNR